MTLEKPKRVKNNNLLNKIRKMDCLACGISPCDPHHITTVKSGGNDVPNNIQPLCRLHHVEAHQIGMKAFANKYHGVRMWLIDHDRFTEIKARGGNV